MRVYAKSIVAFLNALASTLFLYVNDKDITQIDWTVIVIAVLSTLGVYFAPPTVTPEQKARGEVVN